MCKLYVDDGDRKRDIKSNPDDYSSKPNCKFEVNYNKDIIELTEHTDFIGNYVKQVIDLRDEKVFECLKKLGWTPPPPTLEKMIDGLSKMKHMLVSNEKELVEHVINKLKEKD